MAYPVLLHPEVARELYWRIKTRAVRRFATSKLPFRMTFTKSRWVRVPLDRYMCPLLDAGSEDPPPMYLLPQLYHGATLGAISYRTATESVPRIRGTSMPNPAPSILPRGFSTHSDAVVVLAEAVVHQRLVSHAELLGAVRGDVVAACACSTAATARGAISTTG